MLYRVFVESGGPSLFFPFLDVESASGSEALAAAPAGVAAVALPHSLRRELWPDPLTGSLRFDLDVNSAQLETWRVSKNHAARKPT